MEQKRLSEIIRILIGRGYTIDFRRLNACGEASDDQDFVIDEAFCCQERFETGRDIYVFAISSASRDFKGILISGNVSENVDFWNSLSHTLENLKGSLSQFLAGKELSKKEQ